MKQIKRVVASVMVLVLLMGVFPGISIADTKGYQGQEYYRTISAIEDEENLSEKEILQALIQDTRFSEMWGGFLTDVFQNVDEMGDNAHYEAHMPFEMNSYNISPYHLRNNVKYSRSPYLALDNALNDFNIPDGYTAAKLKPRHSNYQTICDMPKDTMHTFYTYSGNSSDTLRLYVFYYDFKFEPLESEFLMSSDDIKPGDQLPDDIKVEYIPSGQSAVSKITNPNLEIIDATKEYSYETSKEISHTTTTSISEGYEVTSSVGTELKFPSPVDIVGGTAEGTYSYNWQFGTEWSDTETTAESKVVTDSITIPLPPHTSVEIDQKSGTTKVSVPYSGMSKITYKVKYILMHTEHSSFRYHAFPLASFNGEENALQDIYDRIERNLLGDTDKDKLEFTVRPFMEWHFTVPLNADDYYKKYKFDEVVSAPMKGVFTLSSSETTINPLEIEPLYNLYSIVPNVYNVSMMTTDEHELRLLDLEAKNRFNVPYYGFNSKTDGEWVVVDPSGNEDLTYAHIEDGLNGKILIADRPGTAYLQFKSNRMPNYESSVVGTDIDPISSDFITVTIDPIEYQSLSLAPELDDMYFNDTNNEIDLNTLVVTGVDTRNRKRTPQDFEWCVDESEGIILNQAEMKITVTAPGTYHIYAKHGETESNRQEVVVHPQRTLNSLQLNGELPRLIWDDLPRASVELFPTLEFISLDQYGDEFPLLPELQIWKLASESTNNALATVLGNTLYGYVVGEDTLTMNYQEIESNGVPVKIISKPYMKEVTFDGDAPLVLHGVDYDLSQVEFKALDQYFENYDMTAMERASITWALADDSELQGLIENGILRITSPMDLTDKKTIELNASVQGEKELFEIPGVILNVETVPELTKVVIIPPTDFSMRVSENANLSLMELKGYDQYGRLFDIAEEPVLWQSSDTDVIDILNNTILHALKEDIEVEITAEVSGVVSETMTIIIKAVPRLKKIRIIGAPSQVYTNTTLDLNTLTVKGYDQYDEEYPLEELLDRLNFTINKKITEASLSSEVISFGSLEGIVGLIAKIDGTTLNDDVNIVVVNKPASNNNNSSGGTKKTSSSGSTKTIVPSTPQSEEAVVIIEEETPEAAGTVTLKHFEDLAGYEWAREAVESLANAGIIQGVSETKFAPGREITRGEFVTLIIRFFDLADSNAELYTDVNPDKYYAETLVTSRALGITQAYNDGTFKPDEAITREDMMVVIYNALMVTGENAKLEVTEESYMDFEDAEVVSEEAVEAVDYLVSTNIINGSLNYLAPNKTSNRAQAAQMLFNLYKILGKVSVE